MLIKTIKFRKLNNNFQEELNNDINQIEKKEKLYVSPDKPQCVCKLLY